MNRSRILIVDDQQLFAESLKTFITNYAEDLEVVALARNGRHALDLAEQHNPNIVLMDVHMPEMNGVEATRLLRERYPDIKVIMLSTYDEDDYVRQALTHGASGYLLKDISPTELIASIRALESGVLQISPQVAAKLVQGIHDDSRPSIQKIGEQFEWFDSLTKREREIFTLIATGYDNEQIADKLCIAEQTVRNHVSIIYSKLEIHDRFQIIQLANKIRYHEH
ncbi:response regulator [Spirochaeta africana]|uniref:Response regulator containing a CheY-like receiver domain and an HTH DNA-binding domain n=1 Tax=Spirochaeta africana (strain ATCC 700263 / DSM 8902 / Z-7692) TaxID=889378 RepID=H9UHP6_SPIAZ|nr:response regulator transcription factor [Spirochaeta africana]AFG37039.1 response regulator containing a CheY-like receiver domain and an HTH DNA-binding domain [Spirochaeta africana DSM 8902]